MICALAKHKLSDVRREKQEREEYSECLQSGICPLCGGKLYTEDDGQEGYIQKCKQCKRVISEEMG